MANSRPPGKFVRGNSSSHTSLVSQVMEMEISKDPFRSSFEDPYIFGDPHIRLVCEAPAVASSLRHHLLLGWDWLS